VLLYAFNIASQENKVKQENTEDTQVLTFNIEFWKGVKPYGTLRKTEKNSVFPPFALCKFHWHNS